MALNEIMASQGQNVKFQTKESLAKESVDKEQFLKLLVAQVRAQDPMKPSDPSAFVAQLATFSQVEQLMNANKKLDNMTMSIIASSNASVVDFLGKQVTVQGDQVSLDDKENPPLYFRIDQPVQEAKIHISNESGTVVKTIDIDNPTPGRNKAVWDGTDDGGLRLPEGNYHVQVNAKNLEGSPIKNVTTEVTGEVSGISYLNGYPEIMVNGQKLGVSQIVEIL